MYILGRHFLVLAYKFFLYFVARIRKSFMNLREHTWHDLPTTTQVQFANMEVCLQPLCFTRRQILRFASDFVHYVSIS